MPLGRFHHLGVAVADIDKALPIYARQLGYTLSDGPYTDPIQRVIVAFLTRSGSSDPVIELVQPASPESPINQYLKKEVGAYHMCFETADIEGTIADLRTQGCMLVAAPAPAVAFKNRRIAWLFMPSRQLIELLEEGTEAQRHRGTE